MRDIVWVLAQYCLGLRNQEVHAIRFPDLREDRYYPGEVVSYGRLEDTKTDTAGRTASYRSVAIPALLREAVEDWALILGADGSVRGGFLIPGNDPAGHLTLDQAKSWNRRRFKPACAAAATDGFGYVASAVPYSLRRGHVSARLRLREDPVVVLGKCGTSLEMLYKHYQHELHSSFDTAKGPIPDQLRDALDGLVRGRPRGPIPSGVTTGPPARLHLRAMSTPSKDPTPAESGRGNTSRLALPAIPLFALGPLVAGSVAYGNAVDDPLSATHAELVTALNGIGATLVFLAAFAFIADAAVRLRHPRSAAIPYFDLSVASLAGWGAMFLAMGVLDRHNVHEVLIAIGVGVLVLTVVFAASTRRW